ncbi:TolC family protein [Deinococcus sp. Leaf326]|uniref:TolC family protein n=1 Tax=Deinococcus sp. Leaf326 TaxID=1736338 RepID=UPI0007014686|nr:TolC family protein [Deinococcus sp. Leaf326]KQR23037.1 transporter [Deinococcus sp. Leaf326]
MNAPPLRRPSRARTTLLTLALGLGPLAAAQTGPAAAPASTAPATPTAIPETAAGSAAGATDLTLETALARLAQAPSVTQAALSVQVAQTNLNAARAALGLSVSVSVSGSAGYTGGSAVTDGSGETTTEGSLSGSAGVNVSLGLLPWSSSQNSLQAAQRSLTLAQSRLVAAQAAARLNVVQQYLAGVIAAQDVTLADQTLTLRQRQLEVAQTQRQSGNATDEDVLSAQAAVQSAQASQLQARASLDAARLGLGAALGTDLGPVSFVTAPPESFALPDLAALVARARTTLPDVVSARNDLADAQQTLADQRRDQTLPDLTASVRYGPASSGGLNASLNLKAGTASAGYTVPLNSGSSAGGTNRVVASVTGSYVVYSPALKAQVSAAQANVTQAQLTLNVTQQNAELNVRTRYATAQSGLITLQSLATGVEVARLGVQTAQTRLAAGVGTADDVTQAGLALGQAQRALQNARLTAQINLIQLDNAAGGLQ